MFFWFKAKHFIFRPLYIKQRTKWPCGSGSCLMSKGLFLWAFTHSEGNVNAISFPTGGGSSFKAQPLRPSVPPQSYMVFSRGCSSDLLLRALYGETLKILSAT